MAGKWSEGELTRAMELPDWAVVDLTTSPNSVWPGKIADADFFDERWQLKLSHAE